MKFLNLFLATIYIILLSCNVAFAFSEPEVLNIDLKTSKYMKLEEKITRIAVGNPEVATVVQVPGSPNEFLIVTHASGSTTLFVWTASDNMRGYIINVSPENIGLAKVIREAIGLPEVQVKVVDKRILLTGNVRNQYERNLAVQTARLYLGGSSKSSLSVGSGIDTSIETQESDQNSTSGNTVGGNIIQGGGEVIDLLHMLKPTQIRLEAQVITIRPQDKLNLGIQYGNSPVTNPGVFSITESSSNLSFRHSTWTRENINLSLNALVTKNLAKILSRPSITTMSGEEAVIQVGGQIPYTVRNPTTGISYTNFKDYGIILQLKPVADAEDRITSTVHAEVSNMSGESVDGQPILDVRRADSVITIRPGSTMVIGGLMDSSERKIVTKFPFLGDIPIIGEFFKYTSKTKDKQELIILVTPYIVDDESGSRAEMSDSLKDIYNRSREERNNLNRVELNESVADESSSEKNFESQEVEKPFTKSKSQVGKIFDEPFRGE